MPLLACILADVIFAVEAIFKILLALYATGLIKEWYGIFACLIVIRVLFQHFIWDGFDELETRMWCKDQAISRRFFNNEGRMKRGEGKFYPLKDFLWNIVVVGMYCMSNPFLEILTTLNILADAFWTNVTHQKTSRRLEKEMLKLELDIVGLEVVAEKKLMEEEEEYDFGDEEETVDQIEEESEDVQKSEEKEEEVEQMDGSNVFSLIFMILSIGHLYTHVFWPESNVGETFRIYYAGFHLFQFIQLFHLQLKSRDFEVRLKTVDTTFMELSKKLPLSLY